MAEESYSDACGCAGRGAPEPRDETPEDSMRRRFGPDYQRTSIELIRSRISVDGQTIERGKSAGTSSKSEGSPGKSGSTGKAGLGGVKATGSTGKTESKICMCGKPGRNGRTARNA